MEDISHGEWTGSTWAFRALYATIITFIKHLVAWKQHVYIVYVCLVSAIASYRHRMACGG